ncbi:MAG: recombination protein RecR [Candidatus Paceibacteria bacterium]|jgi:recombination protein RecR
MSPIDKLTEYFREFPGVGPRQAKRFVYFLLRKNDSYLNDMVRMIPDLKNSVQVCTDCFRYFPINHSGENICNVCGSKRDTKQLIVVARDVDFDAIEKSDEYDGYYFILGGQLPVLEKEPGKKIRVVELKQLVERRKIDGLEEVILALSANPEGDNTVEYLKKELENTGLNISTLGRGLSTGTELEYSDRDTISNALKNRG